MMPSLRLESAIAMQSAFHVAPELRDEQAGQTQLGVYCWQTPSMEGFCLPETDDLIVALHLGGSQKVRAITDAGLSRAVSMPGLATVLPPMRRAAFRTEGSIRLVTLHIPQRNLASASALDARRAFASTTGCFAFRDDYVNATMNALLRAARLQDRPDEYIAKLSDALLCHIGQRDAFDARSAVAEFDTSVVGCLSLQSVIAVIDDGIGSKLTLDQLAAASGLSRAAFSRTFRCATGFSFHEFLTRRRIALATRLLRQSDCGLADIAVQLGFSSQSHFASVFKTIEGCTPGHYRNRLAH